MKVEPQPVCTAESHASDARLQLPVSASAIEKSACLFRALGDAARIRLVAHLSQGPTCVSELAQLEGEAVSVISQRLRVLRTDSLVCRRRDGKHLIYYLADQHILDLVFNGLAHASEKVHAAATTHLIPRYLPTSKEHLQ